MVSRSTLLDVNLNDKIEKRFYLYDEREKTSEISCMEAPVNISHVTKGNALCPLSKKE